MILARKRSASEGTTTGKTTITTTSSSTGSSGSLVCDRLGLPWTTIRSYCCSHHHYQSSLSSSPPLPFSFSSHSSSSPSSSPPPSTSSHPGSYLSCKCSRPQSLETPLLAADLPQGLFSEQAYYSSNTPPCPIEAYDPAREGEWRLEMSVSNGVRGKPKGMLFRDRRGGFHYVKDI